jgi:hypothetical protein
MFHWVPHLRFLRKVAGFVEARPRPNARSFECGPVISRRLKM